MNPSASPATGERIAQARRSAGLSRHDLAAPLGLRIWDIEQLEAGRAEPNDDMLRTLAELLQCSPLWLRTGASLLQMDDKRESDLDERERDLDERERALDERERLLDAREAALTPPLQPAPVMYAGGGNVETLARLVAAHGAGYPERIEEWQATLQAMRSLVGADGALTPELDALARDVFAPLLRGVA